MGVEAERAKVHLGAARVDLYLPGVAGLKERRARLRRIEARLTELGCAVAEVGAQDRWQRAVLGVAVVASTAGGVDRVLELLTAVIERDPQAVVLDVVERLDEIDGDAS